MKALRIHRYGGPEVAKLEDVPVPDVAGAQLRIKVAAASLNPIDFKLRDGKVKFGLGPPLPLTLGCDVAGVVDAIGPEVKGFAVGDEVFSRLEKGKMGGLAEYAVAGEAVVARKPSKLTMAEAASIPLAGLTALQALREVAKLQPGQKVLIHAGAGGVGSLAIQLGKILGGVVATTTSTKNVELVRSLGADLVIDYTKDDVAARAKAFEPDVVFDTLGGASEKVSLAACKRGGVVVGVSGMPDAAFAKASLPGYLRPAIWLATFGRRRAAARAGATFRYLFMRPDGAELAELAAWIEAGKLRPLIHKTYPFADVAEAFAELERGRARGKIVVTL